MKGKSLYVVLIVVGIMLSATHAPNNDAYAQKIDGPKLGIFIVPSRVPADGDSYKMIYIATTDTKNNPSVVGQKLEVRLSSSNTAVGTVASAAFIEAGSYYTVATFRSTETAGTTTISATATGYAGAQASLVTIKSSDTNPAKLSVVALPSPPLPQEGAEGIVIVQLLNSFGTPITAPGDIKVSLTSSNEDVVKVDSSVIIPQGQIYAIAKSETALGSGQSTITASSDNLVPATATVRTGDSQASQLKLYPLPPIMSTTGIDGSWVVIQVEDARGVPVRSFKDIEVSLISSDDKIVLPKEPAVVIRKAQSFVVAKMMPGGKEGKASITPLAEGFLSVPADITAMKPVFDSGERRLAVYSAPPNPAPAATDRVLVAAQVQAKGGAPAPVFRATMVQLSSSNLNLGKFNDNLIIAPNDSFGITSLDFVGFSGETTITASAANFQTKQLKIVVKDAAGSIIDLVPTSSNIPASNSPYPAFLAMVKSGNTPVKAPSDINVFLTSNSDLAGVPAVVKIEKDKSFAVVDVTPKGFPGVITITAKAEGFKDAIKTVTLTEFNPSTLAVFTAFPTLLPSSPEGDELVVVQLQNSKGEPQKNTLSDTNVSLSLYPSSVGTIQESVVVPKGTNFATAKIFLNTIQGDGTVTVNTEGYKLATTRFKTVAFPMDVQLAIQPAIIDINQTASLTVKVTSQGKVVPNAKVKWIYDASVSELISASERTNEVGEAVAVFIPRKDVPQQVSASVTKPGYIEKETSLNFNDLETARGTTAMRPQFSFDVLSILLVSALVAEGFIIYRFYQQKKPLF
jgi:hypothetical protein